MYWGFKNWHYSVWLESTRSLAASCTVKRCQYGGQHHKSHFVIVANSQTVSGNCHLQDGFQNSHHIAALCMPGKLRQKKGKRQDKKPWSEKPTAVQLQSGPSRSAAAADVLHLPLLLQDLPILNMITQVLDALVRLRCFHSYNVTFTYNVLHVLSCAYPFPCKR